MKKAIRALSLVLSFMMVMSCFVGMTFTVHAEEDGLTNVALNQQITATSNYVPPEGFFGVELLVDGHWDTVANGNVKLGWNTNPMDPLAETDPVDITISLDKAYDISKIVVKPMQWSKGENYPRDYELQFSMDGENWTTVAS